MKVVNITRFQSDEIKYQAGDGLAVLRKVPFINRIVLKNKNPIHTFTGMCASPEIQIESTVELQISVKLSEVIIDETLKLFGVMPILKDENIYTCSVDYMEET